MWVLVLWFFRFLLVVSPVFSLVLDPRGRLVALEGTAGCVCEEFEDNDDGISG